MESRYKTSLKQFMDELGVKDVYLPDEPDKLFLYHPEVNRPGLALAGFEDFFDNTRIQIFGRSEITYIESMERELAEKRLDFICGNKPPLLVVTRNLDIPPVLLSKAKEYKIPLCSTDESSCAFLASAISVLSVTLAPRITRHGVFMEILGEGVLILGESGVGKSETAIELIARGHRLIADDAVEIRRVSGRSLVGSAPENIRHFMELRGIGVVNVRRMFGMGSVKITEKINLIVNLEPWDDDKFYDRLGAENLYMDILGVKVPTVTIPVKPGRNLAVIIEAATRNLRLKKLGYNAARDLMVGLGMPEEELPPEERIVDNVFWAGEDQEGKEN